MKEVFKDIMNMIENNIAVNDYLDIEHFRNELANYLTPIKLYGFQPIGHMKSSAFVMSTSIAKARKAVEDNIQKLIAESEFNTNVVIPNIGNLELYDMTICDMDIPMYNDND